MSLNKIWTFSQGPRLAGSHVIKRFSVKDFEKKAN